MGRKKYRITNRTRLIIISILLMISSVIIVSFFLSMKVQYEKDRKAQADEQAHKLMIFLDNITPKKSNIIYPDSLDRPAVSSESVSASKVRLKWNPVRYAEKYMIYRYNPATGKAEPVKKTAETHVNLTDKAGLYAVRAYVKTGKKLIKSSLSKKVKILPASAHAKSYSSLNILKTLTFSNMDTVSVITGNASTTDPQSMSFTGKQYVVSYVNKKGSSGNLFAYSRSGHLVSTRSVSGIGFANGSTCNPNTNRIYIVKSHGDIQSSDCMVFNASDYSYDKTIRLPADASGIAYDESNDMYYISGGAYIYVTDSSFHTVKTIRKKRWDHTQDVGAYNGVVMCCSWKGGSASYIDMYRISDGAYIGSYDVPVGEIESAVIDDGHLVILLNKVGTRRDYICRTKSPAALP